GPVRACPTAHRPMWDGEWGWVGRRPGRSVYMPNGLAVSFRRRQPVTGLTYYLLYELPVVRAEVVLLQRHGLAGTLAEGVVLRFGVAAGREGRRAGVVGRLDPDVPVHLHAGTGRDELADDDVLLQAQERVRLGVDGRVGQHPGGLLEGGRRQPRLGGQRRLGDAHQDGAASGRGSALVHHRAVDLLEPGPLDQLAGQQLGVAGFEHV